MGQVARLRLIRDRFIAGHESCELRRHLDCLPPDTPLRDIVDRCRVWGSHADPSVRRVSKPMPEPAYLAYMVKKPEYEAEPVRAVTVNKPDSSEDQSKELLKKLVTGSIDSRGSCSGEGAGTVTNGQVNPTVDRENR